MDILWRRKAEHCLASVGKRPVASLSMRRPCSGGMAYLRSPNTFLHKRPKPIEAYESVPKRLSFYPTNVSVDIRTAAQASVIT